MCYYEKLPPPLKNRIDYFISQVDACLQGFHIDSFAGIDRFIVQDFEKTYLATLNPIYEHVAKLKTEPLTQVFLDIRKAFMNAKPIFEEGASTLPQNPSQAEIHIRVKAIFQNIESFLDDLGEFKQDDPNPVISQCALMESDTQIIGLLGDRSAVKLIPCVFAAHETLPDTRVPA